MDDNRISIHHPHDRLFRLCMTDVRLACELFTAHLPGYFLQHINLDILRLENTSFIDNYFQATAADILYSAETKDGKGYVYFLIEHQSTVNKRMAYRSFILRARILELHCKQYPNKPLPLIYTMVLYSGKRRWNAPTDILDLMHHPEGIVKGLGSHSYLLTYMLIELNQISDGCLRGYGSIGLMEYLLKHNRGLEKKKDFGAIFFPWVEALGEQFGIELFKVMLRYVLDNMNYNSILFEQHVKQYISSNYLQGEAMTLAQQYEQRGEQRGIEKGRQEAMTLAQQYEQRGIEKGKQEGMQKGEQRGRQQATHEFAKRLLEAGQTLNFIAKMTGLTAVEIQALQDKH